MGLIRDHGLDLHKHTLTFWQLAPTPSTVLLPKSQPFQQLPMPSSPTPPSPDKASARGGEGAGARVSPR